MNDPLLFHPKRCTDVPETRNVRRDETKKNDADLRSEIFGIFIGGKSVCVTKFTFTMMQYLENDGHLWIGRRISTWIIT